MKKFGKILAILLSLVVAVTALVVIGAADDTDTGVTEINDEIGFLSAIANGGSYKLGGDITLSQAVTNDAGNYVYWINTFKTVSIDLNGKTLDMSDRYLNIKDNGSAVTVTITGEGTIKTSSGSYIAVVYRNAANTVNSLVVNGTGNGITVVQEAYGKGVFQLGNSYLGCNVTVSGKLTFKPYSGGKNDVTLFALGKSGETLAETANLTLSNAEVTIEEYSLSASNATVYNGVYFASVGDGANVVIKDSTVTVKHGHFIKAGSFKTNAHTAATGSNGQVTGVTAALPEFTAKIDIDDSKISALNSGYGATAGTANTNGGTLFNIGWNPVEIRVDNTDLVGTNRTIGNGNAARGQYKLSPTYYYFTNVNFTSAPISYYGSSWLLQEHVNMKWDGGVIDLKNGNANTGTTSGFGQLALGGTYYSDEITYGVTEGSNNVGWSGILFENCYFKTAPSNTTFVEGNSDAKVTFTLGGIKYTNVPAIINGELVTYPVACFNTLVPNKTSTFEAADGLTKKFGTLFEGNDKTAYAESADGYVKLAVSSTDASSYAGIWYFGTAADAAHKNENGTFIVSEFDLASENGAYTTISAQLISRFEKHSYSVEEDEDGNEQLKDDGILGYYNNKGTWVTFRMMNNDYSAFYLNSDGTLDLSNRYTSYAKNNGNDVKSISLPTDGTWTRISIVYEIIAEKVTYCPVEESDLTKEAWDFSKSKAHLYIDGVWAATKEGIFPKEATPWQTNVKTNAYVDAEYADTFDLDSLRLNYYTRSANTTTCIDNVRLSYYTPSNAAKAEGLQAIAADASAVSLGDYKNDFLVMPAASEIEQAKATVNWVINGTTVGTSTPLAGSAVGGVAPGADVAAAAKAMRDKLDNGWYDYGFTGWTVTDAEGNTLGETDKLTENATYTFTAVCKTPILPEGGVAGIKLNLSLRLNFDLNFYVPVPQDSDVQNVMIKNGNTRLNSGTDSAGNVVYGTEVTIEGVSYTKHRDTYDVTGLTSETYTLSFTVGETVITQDIVYGVSDYVGQYMTVSKDDGDTVARRLIMQMVNYVVKVVEHADSGITKTDEIDAVIAKYNALLEKYPALLTTTESTYFTTDEAVLAKIESSKKSMFGADEDGNANTAANAPENKAGYYVEGAVLYFSTGTPKFVFKYTDNALDIGIKLPASNGTTGYAGTPGIFAYTGYNTTTQGVHLAYEGDIKNGTKLSSSDSVWGTDTKTDGSVTYYATMVDDLFRERSFAVYELLKNVTIDITYTYSTQTTNDSGEKVTTWVNASKASSKYCLEWYINGLVTGNANSADVDLAIALYDYAKLAYQFVYGTEYTPAEVE